VVQRRRFTNAEIRLAVPRGSAAFLYLRFRVRNSSHCARKSNRVSYLDCRPLSLAVRFTTTSAPPNRRVFSFEAL
jgi:hypothetical protein